MKIVRPTALVRAGSGEEFRGERLHDLPLLAVRVLGLVDEDVIGAAIELVAHPFAHSRRGEKLPRPGNQVVEVGDSGASLRLGVSGREGLSRPQSGGHVRRQASAILHRQQFADESRDTPGIDLVVRFGLLLPGRNPRGRLFGQDHLAQRRKLGRALDRRQREPILDVLGKTETGLRAPFAIGLGNRLQQVAVEPFLMAMMGKELFDRAVGQVHQALEERLDQLGRTQLGHRIGHAGTAHQIIDRALFPEPQAEALHVADELLVSVRLRVREKVGERRPGKLLLRPALDRLETGRDPGLRRKRREQRLREAVDGLDAKAARRLQHLGEQAPGPFPRGRTRIGSKRHEIGAELGILHPHPGRETRSDAVRHFRRAGLGESQAQDGLGIRPVQKQAQHAARKHLRLPRASGCRHRRMHVGIDGGGLRALQSRQRLESCNHQAAASIVPAALIDERTRIGLKRTDMADESDSDDASEQRRTKLVKAGFAVGIGSAAIVAALLYASKVKKKPR